jgi:type II secretory pathway pseudopilin PulG
MNKGLRISSSRIDRRCGAFELLISGERRRKAASHTPQAGFSALEMVLVVAMSVIITAIAIPGYMSTTRYLRVIGDLRSINGLTAQAKMRAASDFTHARIYADLNANAYHLEVWNKTGNGGAGCWQTDGDVNNPCTAANSPVFNLSQGDTFGTGNVTSGPTAAQQPTIPAQPACQATNGGNGTIQNTECIVFNSRGIPVDSNNSPTAIGAVYVTNGIVVDGVTVSATGSIQAWSTSASGQSQQHWYGQ